MSEMSKWFLNLIYGNENVHLNTDGTLTVDPEHYRKYKAHNVQETGNGSVDISDQLQRWGLPDADRTAMQCDDGYWTPWHIAENLLIAIRSIKPMTDADVYECGSTAEFKEGFNACVDAIGLALATQPPTTTNVQEGVG